MQTNEMKLDPRTIATNQILGAVIMCMIDAGFRVEISDQDGGGMFIYGAADNGDRPGDGFHYWVRFEPENGPADCIVDYTTNLEDTLKEANALAAAFQ